MKLTKRILALLLAFSMCASMVTPAYASEAQEDPVVVETTETVAESTDIIADEEEVISPVVEELEAKQEAAQTNISAFLNFKDFEAVEGEYQTYTATMTAAPGNMYTFAVYGLCEGVMVQAGNQTFEKVAKGKDYYEFKFDSRDAYDVQEIPVTIILPAGVQMNPDVLYDGRYTLNVEQDYFFTRTALDRSTLFVEISSESDNWTYVINNLTSGVEGTKHSSADGEAAVWSEAVPVKANDEIQLVIGTADGQPDNVVFDIGFAVAEGTVSNPIVLEAEEFEIQEDGTLTKTVAVAAETTDYFRIDSFNQKELLINGENGVIINSDFFVFSVKNEEEEEQEFVLTIQHPLGSEENPVVLNSTGTYDARILRGIDKKCHYTHEVTYSGILKFFFHGTPGDEFTITKKGEDASWTTVEDAVDGVIEVPVMAGDELEITIFNEKKSGLRWSFEYVQGSSVANPYILDEAWNEEEIKHTETLTIPAGSTIYAKAKVGGLVLTVPETVTVAIWDDLAEEEVPYTGEVFPSGFSDTYFVITNNGEEETVELRFAPPLGSTANPECIEELGGSVLFEEGNAQEYFYSYTAKESGDLTVWLTDVPEGVVADLTVYNNNDPETEDSVLEIGKYRILETVSEGEEIMIRLSRMAEDGESYPEAEISWEGEISDSWPGESAYAAIEIEDLTQPVQISVPGGRMLYYQAAAGGMVLECAEDVKIFRVTDLADQNAGGFATVMYEPGSVLPYEDMTILAIQNNTGEDTLTLTFGYPVGSEQNPAVLEELGRQDNANLQGDDSGYYAVYTAEADGNLEFFSVEDAGGDILVTLPDGQVLSWAENVEDGILTVPVMEGEEIAIHTSTGISVWNVNYRRGEILNPADFEWVMISDVEFRETVIVPAKSTYYYVLPQDLLEPADMEFTITGSKAATVTASSELGLVRTIVNSGKKDKTYELKLVYPVGSAMNLDTMVLGKETAKITNGNESGYAFTWTAPAEGILSFAMTTKSGWKYRIDNVTDGEEGAVCSDDINIGDNIKNQAIFVEEGDELQIIVNKTPDKKTGTIKAGSITFTTAFTPFEYTVASGKAISLNYVHPETGVAYAASKVDWEIYAIHAYNPYAESFDSAGMDLSEYENEKGIDRKYFSSYATIKNGKLSTYKNGDSVYVFVRAWLKGDKETSVMYRVEMLPATTMLSAMAVEFNDDNLAEVCGSTFYWGTRQLDLNGMTAEDDVFLAYTTDVSPFNSDTKVNWKVSGNARIVEDEAITTFGYPISVIKIYPIWDKNGKLKTGVATITGTAADGSGKKVSFKVEMTKLPHNIEIVDSKNNPIEPENQWSNERTVVVDAGKSVTLKAIVDPAAAKDKKGVLWKAWYRGQNLAKNGKITVPKDAVNGEEIYVVATAVADEYVADAITLVVNSAKTSQYVEVSGFYADQNVEGWYYTQYLPAIDVSDSNAEDPCMYICGYAVTEDAFTYDIAWSLDKNGQKIAMIEEGWFTWGAYDEEGEKRWHFGREEEIPEDCIDEAEPVIKLIPLYDGNKDTYKTGTVKLTATASDSVTKQTVSVKIEKRINRIEIVSKDGREAYIQKETYYMWDEETKQNIPYEEELLCIDAIAGEKIQLVAKVNDDAKNKAVQWFCEDESATISKSGVLTINKDISVYGDRINVAAVAVDSAENVWADLCINVVPRASNVHARIDFGTGMKYITNSTQVLDLKNVESDEGEPKMLELSALVYPFTARQDVQWTLDGSGKKVASIEEMNGRTYLVFNGKLGKIGVTATAQDGSKEKATFYLNLVTTIDEIECKYEEPQYTFAGKTLKLESFLKLNPEKPTAKDLSWSMVVYDYEEGMELLEPDSVATLDVRTGVLKVKKVTKPYTLEIGVEDMITGKHTDFAIFVMPKAMTGVVLKDVNGKTIKNGATVVVNDEDVNFVQFTIEPKNIKDKTLYTYDGLWAFDGMIDNDNIAVLGYNEEESVAGVLHTGEAGKVKVTVRTMDGTNKSAYFFVDFKHDHRGED